MEIVRATLKDAVKHTDALCELVGLHIDFVAFPLRLATVPSASDVFDALVVS